jgi:hypothetical protein
VGALDVIWHLGNFLLPAIGMGLLAATGAKLLWRSELAAVPWGWLARDASLAGIVTLMGGLAVFRQDGRMLTYGAMVLACAFTLWWRGFGPGRH